MGTFYSIVYCQIRPEIKEQLSIAMIMVTDATVIFKIAWEKVSFLKQLIGKDATDLIALYLRNMQKKVIHFKKKSAQYSDNSKTQILPVAPDQIGHFRYGFFEYLHSYSNNLITFSSPQRIDIDGTEESFSRLYAMMVSASESRPLAHESSRKIKEIKHQLFPRLKPFVNTSISIDSVLDGVNDVAIDSPQSSLPNVIDVLGKNSAYVSAQFVDFNKKEYHLSDYLSHYTNFIREFDNDSKHFIIGDEPETASERNIKIWKEWKSYRRVKVLQLSEIPELEDYLTHHNVRPILQEVEALAGSSIE